MDDHPLDMSFKPCFHVLNDSEIIEFCSNHVTDLGYVSYNSNIEVDDIDLNLEILGVLHDD